MKPLPSLSSLQSFCIAAKHQSFTKAANELNQTHGAVSRAVKQLEDYFGIMLFERRNRRLYITSKGTKFAEQITILLQQIEDACVELTSSPSDHKLAISCEPSLAMRWLMPRLEEFRSMHTGLDIHLSTAGGPIDLAESSIDIAVRRSDFKWAADYWVTDLGKEAIGPVCSPAYLRKHSDLNWTLLHTRSRNEAWYDWKQLSDQDIQCKTEKFFDHFYFSLQAAVAGMGVAIGPKVLVEDDLRNNLLIAPFGFKETPVSYVALSLKNPASNDKAHAFVNWMKNAFATV
ncbi:LysR family transcriptional regulator [Sneathiella sp. P13V-1]|uniref:LysR substrate-binding domain-containing protein n=1 Tax=Sneathiella sp. P13V-1 TaxID=2697366 RepID=UPI00187B6C0D|nr:LysR substrate-binding domain-containing protein [Sneathiella sp. P13V-1]MBE7637118.1 LysR family transcriptional regulator [Sneathiella sp. P13V-1]